MLYQDHEADKEANDTGEEKTGICLTNKDIRHTIRINGPSETEKKYSMDSTTLEWEYRILIVILFPVTKKLYYFLFLFYFCRQSEGSGWNNIFGREAIDQESPN